MRLIWNLLHVNAYVCTSGTAAGNQYGVAKRASIIAVKVLSDEG